MLARLCSKVATWPCNHVSPGPAHLRACKPGLDRGPRLQCSRATSKPGNNQPEAWNKTAPLTLTAHWCSPETSAKTEAGRGAGCTPVPSYPKRASTHTQCTAAQRLRIVSCERWTGAPFQIGVGYARPSQTVFRGFELCRRACRKRRSMQCKRRAGQGAEQRAGGLVQESGASKAVC